MIDVLDETALELGLDIKNYPGKWKQAKKTAFLTSKRDYPEETPFQLACRHFIELGGEKIKTYPLDFLSLRNANVERCENSFKHSINDWSPSDWAMATAGELGELCNFLKKRHRGEDVDQQDIADEIADTLIYLDLLAARLDIDLTTAVRNKFNAVSDRVGSKVKL